MLSIETGKQTGDEDLAETKSTKSSIKRFPRKIKRFPRNSSSEEIAKPNYRVIVKKDLDDEGIRKWLSTAEGWITGLTSDFDGNPNSLYDYQIQHIGDTSDFRDVDKSRQIGFSYGKSLEALFKSHAKLLHTSIFISIGQEEANEKIRFAKWAYDSMPEEYKRKIVVDNKQSLEFEYKGFRTRILSFAQRQPRGKGNNTDILLDEFAHMMWAKEIYTASLPVISRGSGTITLGSTPLGKNSLHYEIFNDRKKYNMYSRMRIFWWDCPALCTNVAEARKLAPYLNTSERVDKFGTKKLRAIYVSMDEDQFQQEYELYTADESLSYYPLDLINRCVFEDETKLILEGNIDPEEIAVGFAPLKTESGIIIPDTIMNYYKDEHINWYHDHGAFSESENVVDNVSSMIDKLLFNMVNGEFGRNLLLGMDIGRNKDSSEISLLEEIELETHNLHVERMSIELAGIPFRKQKEVVKFLLSKLPITKFYIDGTLGSLGEDMAESLTFEYPNIVEAMQFDLETKAKMAKNMRFRFEDRAIALFNNSHTVKQIHAIKKTITDSSNVKFGVEKGKNHHGDKFWAIALASMAGNSYDRDRVLKTDNIFRLGNLRSFNQNENVSNSIVRVSGDPLMTKISKELGEKKLRLVGNNDIGPMNEIFFDKVVRGRY